MGVNPCLLSLPVFDVGVQLEAAEIFCAEAPALQIQFGELPERFNLLPQDHHLILAPGEVRGDLHRVGQGSWIGQGLQRDKLGLVRFGESLQLADDVRLSLQVTEGLNQKSHRL